MWTNHAGSELQLRVEGPDPSGGIELVTVIAVAFTAREESLVQIILLLLSTHGFEVRSVLGGVLDELVDPFVEYYGRTENRPPEEEGRRGKVVRVRQDLGTSLNIKDHDCDPQHR